MRTSRDPKSPGQQRVAAGADWLALLCTEAQAAHRARLISLALASVSDGDSP